MDEPISRRNFIQIILLMIISLFTRGIKIDPKPTPKYGKDIVIDWRDNDFTEQDYIDQLFANLDQIANRAGRNVAQGYFSGLDRLISPGSVWDGAIEQVLYSPDGENYYVVVLPNQREQEDRIDG